MDKIEKFIRKLSTKEREALLLLLFQLKKAPDDVARQWYEWIIKR